MVAADLYLSWLRNGLLGPGFGIVSDGHRDTGYGFFILGGVCVSYGAALYLANPAPLRRPMTLPVCGVVAIAAALLARLWLCALSRHLGSLEAAATPKEPPEK